MKMIDYNLLRGKITAMQSTEPEYAYNFLNNAMNPSTEWECIEDMLDNMEVYEAEPVKRGKWCPPLMGQGKFATYCSRCHYTVMRNSAGIFEETPFCPHCGADMRGDTNG